MALVTGDINWQGYGKITDADTTTSWAVIKTTAGGATPSVALADGGLQGATTAQAITTTSNNKRILLYYDIGSGNELDFTPSTGAQAGQYVWVWGNFLASSLLQTVASGGFGIMLGTDNGGTVEWSLYYFYGSDNYAGGWKRMVIDPTKTASLTGSGTTESGGGITLSSVRYFGITAYTNATARFDNMVVDRMDVGTGYAVDGTGATSDAFMSDLLSVEESVANWWGVVQRLNDSGNAYELTGKLTLGDSVGTTATTITDINAKIFAGEPKYYNASLVASIPVTATGIEVVGNGTGATSVTLGKAVGTAEGRNGWTVVGNATYDVNIDFDDGNVNTMNVYGCSFEGLTGTLSWGTNTSHNLFSTAFVDCGQFDPVGGIEIRNCTFSGYAGTEGALLWNSSMNIEDCNFIANTDGTNNPSGIEIPATTVLESGTAQAIAAGMPIGFGLALTYAASGASSTVLVDSAATFITNGVSVDDAVTNVTDNSTARVVSVDSETQLTTTTLTGGSDNTYANGDSYTVTDQITFTDLVFSGNDWDVYNSDTEHLTVAKSGTSNPASYNTTGGVVSFVGSVTVKVTVLDGNNDPVENAQTSVYLTNGTEILNADSNASGIASTSYSGSTPASVVIRVRKSSSGTTRYENYSTTGTIQSGTGLDVTAVLRTDNIVAA
jgi:hypothetical protein